jgi:hypothetical protein
MNSTDLAYIAGWFDGEGYIIINDHGSLVVGASNTFLPVLQLLHLNFGGSVVDKVRPQNTKPIYQWYLKANNNALSFLLQIAPYLNEKRPQAELAIQVFTTPSWHTGITRKEARVRLQEMKTVEYMNTIEVGITEELRAYLAGYLDAEGCFTLAIASSCRVAVGCTHFPIIKLLQYLFSGSYGDNTQPDSNKRLYSWRVGSEDAIFMLQIVEPYLFEKRPQAKLLLDLFTKPTWETGLNKELVDKELRRLKRVPSYRLEE